MLILGIETSCDETAAALVEAELASKVPLKVLSSVVASSAEIQVKYGGILPEQAARKQVLAMTPVLKECLERAGLNESSLGSGKEIDAIAITTGPGLVGSLLVGVETAKTLAFLWEKPIVPVNHLVAHLYANWLENSGEEKQKIPAFPAIGLVVSGGHTDMVLMKDDNGLTVIGSTRDDAAGECFDKTARVLGLPYPGGPEISKLAESYRQNNPQKKLKMFPRPLAGNKTFDWSFSGLKTSVLYSSKKVEEKDRDNNWKEMMAAEIEEAICDSLVDKLVRAVDQFKPKSILVAGGVAANKRLKEMIGETVGGKADLFIPKPKLCTDNGSYIAVYAFYNYYPIAWEEIDVEPGMTISDGR